MTRSVKFPAITGSIAILLVNLALAMGVSAQDFRPGQYVNTLTRTDLTEESNPLLVGFWRISFLDDGQFTVEHNGRQLAQGRYRIEGNELVMDDQAGPIACNQLGYEPGRYRWQRDGLELQLTKIADDCDGRADVLSLRSLIEFEATDD